MENQGRGVEIANPHLKDIEVDHFHHLGIDRTAAPEYSDVKVIRLPYTQFS